MVSSVWQDWTDAKDKAVRKRAHNLMEDFNHRMNYTLRWLIPFVKEPPRIGELTMNLNRKYFVLKPFFFTQLHQKEIFLEELPREKLTLEKFIKRKNFARKKKSKTCLKKKEKGVLGASNIYYNRIFPSKSAHSFHGLKIIASIPALRPKQNV